jgi:hypothetical protein
VRGRKEARRARPGSMLVGLAAGVSDPCVAGGQCMLLVAQAGLACATRSMLCQTATQRARARTQQECRSTTPPSRSRAGSMPRGSLFFRLRHVHTVHDVPAARRPSRGSDGAPGGKSCVNDAQVKDAYDRDQASASALRHDGPLLRA